MGTTGDDDAQARSDEGWRMNRIDELIAQLCPEGVVFRALGKCAGYSDTRIDANALDETNFVGVENLLQNTAGKTDASYPPNTARLTAYEVGDILLGNIRPYLKKIWLANDSGGCSGDVLAIRIAEACRSELIPEFLYRVLASDAFFAYSMQHVKGAKMPRGNKEAILNYRIPIPPLEIQREIVKVLDAFSALEAELEAELEARRQQYQHYRDRLLSYEQLRMENGEWRIGAAGDEVAQARRGDVRWATLGEVGAFVRGSGIQKSDFTESGVGCIHYGQIHTYYGTWATQTKSFVSKEHAARLRKANPGNLVITTTSEDDEAVAKAVAWIGAEDVAVSTDAYIFRHSLNPKYVAYFFQTDLFQSQKKPHITGTKVRRISGEGLAKIRIPVPSLAEQARIVAILDRFDALVNDLSSGLPAELEARRQQYAHYRDRLLTFGEWRMES